MTRATPLSKRVGARSFERGGHGHQPVPPSRSVSVASEAAVRRTTLDNGIEVLSEKIPGVRSASLGVWVRRGGAHESGSELGISHLLEHMVFKGTERRSAREIALSLEALGGSLDAYTSREHTAYQARVLDAHLPEAMDVLADLVCSPALRHDDLSLEREVVLEEIAQVEDTPDDLVFELHGQKMWKGHPYGHSILGTEDSVRGATIDDLTRTHGRAYRGRSLLIAAAGNVDHSDLVSRAEHHFGAVESGEAPETIAAPPERGAAGDTRMSRDSAQSHVVFGAIGPEHAHPLRYAVVLLSSTLGGGMSSRLFQRVREEMGLCYSVFTYQSFYGKGGVVGVYVGTRPGTEEAAVSAVRLELDRVAREGLPVDELEMAKQQLKGQVMLSMESTGARLSRLSSAALHGERLRTLDEILERVNAVTGADIAEAAEEWFHPDRHLVLRLGPDA